MHPEKSTRIREEAAVHKNNITQILETTTSDLYLGRLLSSATIFFPHFCNRCSSDSYFLTQGGKESVDIAAQHKPQQAGGRAGRQEAKKVIQN
jgi:hypothetical protein